MVMISLQLGLESLSIWTKSRTQLISRFSLLMIWAISFMADLFDYIICNVSFITNFTLRRTKILVKIDKNR